MIFIFVLIQKAMVSPIKKLFVFTFTLSVFKPVFGQAFALVKKSKFFKTYRHSRLSSWKSLESLRAIIDPSSVVQIAKISLIVKPLFIFLIAVIFGCCVGCCCYYNRLFFVLSGKK